MILLKIKKFKKQMNNLEVGTFVVKFESSCDRSMSYEKNFDREKPRSKSRPRKDINHVECYYCHELRHMQYQCKELRAN
jgi:hypothetical protein